MSKVSSSDSPVFLQLESKNLPNVYSFINPLRELIHQDTDVAYLLWTQVFVDTLLGS